MSEQFQPGAAMDLSPLDRAEDLHHKTATLLFTADLVLHDQLCDVPRKFMDGFDALHVLLAEARAALRSMSEALAEAQKNQREQRRHG